MLELFSRFGIPPSRLSLIPPYSFPALESATPLPEELRAFFALHSPVLLTVSGLEPEYDLPLQFRVLGLILERHPSAGLVVIGQGSLENELRSEIQSKPYAGRILLCGDLSHAATLRAVQECNVFLRTTLFDGDSISIREALHMGVPVVASDNGMRPPGVYLVPPRDLAALRQAIEDCLSVTSPPRPRELTSDDQNLVAIVRLYRELLSN